MRPRSPGSYPVSPLAAQSEQFVENDFAQGYIGRRSRKDGGHSLLLKNETKVV